LRVVVAEDGALELPRVDAFLDQPPVVVAEGEVPAGISLGPRLALGDADGGSAVGRLDEEREAKIGFLARKESSYAGSVPRREGKKTRGRDVGVPEERFEAGLVHADRGARDAGSDVGDPEELEKT